MPESRTKPARSLLRRTSSWCVRLALLALLALGYAFLHINQIGLPDFIKQPILAQLRTRGIELDFSRIRFRLTRGIVAENVRLVRQGTGAGEEFSADELQLRFNRAALLKLRPEIRGLRLREGRVSTLLSPTNEPPFTLQVEHLDAVIHFIGSNHWELVELKGRCLGGEFTATGALTNVQALARKRDPARPPTDAWKRSTYRWARQFEAMRFSQAPRLDVSFAADALDPSRTVGRIRLAAGGAETEFGRLADVELDAEIKPGKPVGETVPLHVDVSLRASGAETRWAGVRKLQLTASFEQPPTNRPPERLKWVLETESLTNKWFQAGQLRIDAESIRDQVPETSPPAPPVYGSRLELQAANVQAEKGRLPAFHMTGSVRHAFTNWLDAALDMNAQNVVTAWGEGGSVAVKLSAKPVPVKSQAPELGFWNGLYPFAIHGSVALTNLVSPKLTVATASVDLDWQAPRLELRSLETSLYGGTGSVKGSLDVATRRAIIDGIEDIDLHSIAGMLTANARQWLSQYTWTGRPPTASAQLGVTLPSWTNRHPDWRAEVLPTLTMAGRFEGRDFAFRGVPGTRAEGVFSLTNAAWYIPRIRVQRPEGSLEFSYDGHMLTHDYHFVLRSTIDPRIVEPLLEEGNQRKAFTMFSLSQPPLVEGEVWGRWFDRERIGFRARVVATNSTIRGEPCDFVDGRVGYTNRMLSFGDVTFHQGEGRATVPGAAYWVMEQLLSFTNAVSTLRPDSVLRVIGPKVSAMLAPYHFVLPPRVVINGTIGTSADVLPDARFDVEGGEFHWMRLRADAAKAVVRAVSNTVTISNMVASVYGGQLEGDLNFDQSPSQGSVFNFGLNLTNVDLRRLMLDVSDRTNRMEGQLSGVLNLDEAHSWDTNSWRGHGQLSLREGLLWDTPVFGVFSPIFDGISPGLGQTRFSSGHAHFVVTNSVARTDNLEVRSPAIRLKYSGSVGLDSRLDARMEAELLKDLPLLGPMLSVALSPFTKLFEYKVRGTLMRPEAEPLYIPRLLLVPLHPLKTLKDIFGSGEKKSPDGTAPRNDPVPNP